MNNLISEYPKAISRFIIGALVTYLTGKIPAEYLSPELVEYAQIILGGLTIYLVGRFTRLPKSEVPLTKNRNQIIND